LFSAKEDDAMPETRQACTPYLCCRDAAQALAFYEKAFGAEVRQRYTSPDGRIGHAEFGVEGATFYLSDEWPEEGVFSPAKYGGTAVALLLLVKDVDAFAQRAVDAGATLVRAPRNEPHGDRAAVFHDPFGHRWFVATPIENVSVEEVQARVGDAFAVEER
jgi:PhnB protein